MPPTAPLRLVVPLIVAVLACSASTDVGPPDGRSVLFIGNSLTYTNDLPAMLERVARAAGDSLLVGSVTGGNMAVIDHVNGRSEVVARVDEGGWTFVVLQQGPTPAGICRDTLILAAMRLAPHVRGGGGRAVLFLPWARRGFPQSLDAAAASATAAARAAGGVVAPVGIAWHEARERDPDEPAARGYPARRAHHLRPPVRPRRARDPAAAIARMPAGGISEAQVRTLAAAAHTASTSLPADPATPDPADTTLASPLGSGPC